MANLRRASWCCVGLAFVLTSCGDGEQTTEAPNTLRMTVDATSHLSIFTTQGSLIRDESGRWFVLSLAKNVIKKDVEMTATEAAMIRTLCKNIAETTRYGNAGEGGEGFDMVVITYGKYTTLSASIGAKDGNFPADVKKLRDLVISYVER